MKTTELTAGRLLARNAAWNLASQALPIAVAIVSMPILIRGMGTDRFGLLTLAWMVLGFSSLFDLGLGRALTKLVAELLGRGRGREVPPLVWTASGLMAALGVSAASLVWLISPWLVRDALRVPAPLQGEALIAFDLMAIALPFVISTAGLRGIMEAHQRFGPINLVRTAISLFTLIGPLLVLPFSRSLVPIVGVLVVGRAASWLIHLLLCLFSLPELRREVAFRRSLIGPLLRYGGWMTVVNLVNPLMVQMDRFLIGALISSAAVAYYSTPFELVTKLWIVSSSVLGVVFPAFATSFVVDEGGTASIFSRSVKSIFVVLFPIVLGFVTLAPEGLSLWLGPEFAHQSTPVLRWLAVGVLLNGLSQVASALLQAIGRPDLTAKLHLVELPPYLIAAWYLIGTWGIAGAALAWTGRIALDMLLFFWAARSTVPGLSAPIARLGRYLGAGMVLLAIGALPTATWVRVLYLVLAAAGFGVIAWRRLLDAEEKEQIVARFPARWRSTRPLPGSPYACRQAGLGGERAVLRYAAEALETSGTNPRE
jgi:O-antigen/teichoic acid export membrane protein